MHYVQEIVEYVPGCAALFDRMTTWVVTQRLTAHEALEFLRNTTDDLDHEAFNTPLRLEPADYLDGYWGKLTPEIYQSWSQFRTPPVTWWSSVLEWFLQYKVTRRPILALRRLLDI